jgi:drug/metabolite transporter superfamily protein YnfA
MQKKNSILNIMLWLAQGLLALTLIWTALMKLFNSDDLPWQWIKENPSLVKITGILDLIAGIGVVVPTLLRIKTKLTIYAAYGTVALMMGAIIVHISRGETSRTGFNVFVIFIALFIAWGRQKKYDYDRL